MSPAEMAASAASLVRATSAVARMFPAAPARPGTPPPPPPSPESPKPVAPDRPAPERPDAQPQRSDRPRGPDAVQAGGQQIAARAAALARPSAAPAPPADRPGPPTAAPASQPATPFAAPGPPAAPASQPATPLAAPGPPTAKPGLPEPSAQPARPGRARTAAKSPTGVIPPPTGSQAYRAVRGPARRWQLTGLVIAVVVLAGVLIGVTVLRHPAPPVGGNPAGSSLIAGETAVRGQAVSWVTAQVDHNIAIACDSVMCSDLAQHGFPPGNLNVLAPTAPDPYGSGLLIASADVRSQFASRLAFFAPAVIASFGTGAASIDVRVIAADGAAYQAALRRDLQMRKASGTVLAGNKHVTVTPAARAQLLSGEVDLRLLTALAFLATQQPVSIVSFGSFAPGAAAAVPLRWAYLAESDPAVRMSTAAYVQSLMTFARNLRPPYAPLNVSPVNLPGARKALRIEFAAPSPLGLLRT